MERVTMYGQAMDALSKREARACLSYRKGELLRKKLEEIQKKRLAAGSALSADLNEFLQDFLAVMLVKLQQIAANPPSNEDLQLLENGSELTPAQISELYARHRGNDVMTLALRRYADERGMEIPTNPTIDEALLRVAAMTENITHTAATTGRLDLSMCEGALAAIDDHIALIERA